MDNQKLTAALGLKADATEFEIQAALDTLRTEREEAAKLQEELKQTREARIKLLLDGAMSAGKIKPEQRGLYEANAAQDHELTAQIIDALPVAAAPVKPSTILRGGSPATGTADCWWWPDP